MRFLRAGARRSVIRRAPSLALLALGSLFFQGEVNAPDCPAGYHRGFLNAPIGGITETSSRPFTLGQPGCERNLPQERNVSEFVTIDGVKARIQSEGVSRTFEEAKKTASASFAAVTSTSKPARHTGQGGDNGCDPLRLGSDLPESSLSHVEKLEQARRARARSRETQVDADTPDRVPANDEPPSPASSPASSSASVANPVSAADPAPGIGPSIIAPNVFTTWDDANAISDLARGIELADAGSRVRQVVQQNAVHDHDVVSKYYQSRNPQELVASLQKAQESLGGTIELLDKDTSSTLEPSEKARFRNHYLNARDKAQLGSDAIRDHQQSEQRSGLLGANSPLAGLMGFGPKVPKVGDPLSKTPALAEIFGGAPQGGQATSSDALTNRMVMLSGLPDEQREQALQRLKLLERPKFALPGGKQVTVNLLHNGYLLGGGASGIDCSSFVSSVLPADVRRGRFTTLDFRTMWIYARTQRFPSPPKYTPERAKLVIETSKAFAAIDLYAGEPLRVGDILVYRFQSDPIGHVVIVRSYNPETLRAEIVEAAQSAGTVRERTLNLSAAPLTSKRRLLMPGLWPLRLKPVSNPACTYKDNARVPASRPQEEPSPEGVAR